MTQIHNFTQLAQSSGTFSYDTHADELHVRRGLAHMFGRAIGWLRNLLQRPAPNDQEQAVQKFLEAFNSFYGEAISDSVLAQKSGRALRRNHPPALNARAVRRLVSQGEGAVARALAPALAALVENPNDLKPMWRVLHAHKLAPSAFLQEAMARHAPFPEGSAAEEFRNLAAEGFLRGFSTAPTLTGTGEATEMQWDNQLTQSQTTSTRAHAPELREIAANINTPLVDTPLSADDVLPYCSGNKLDAERFFRAQCATGTLLGKDLRRNFASTQYNINERTSFNNPHELLQSVWLASGRDATKFAAACTMLTQIPGKSLFWALQKLELREQVNLLTDVASPSTRGKTRASQQYITLVKEGDTLKFAHAHVEEQDGGHLRMGDITKSGADAFGGSFQLPKTASLKRQRQLGGTLTPSGVLELTHLRASFNFATPLFGVRAD